VEAGAALANLVRAFLFVHGRFPDRFAASGRELVASRAISRFAISTYYCSCSKYRTTSAGHSACAQMNSIDLGTSLSHNTANSSRDFDSSASRNLGDARWPTTHVIEMRREAELALDRHGIANVPRYPTLSRKKSEKNKKNGKKTEEKKEESMAAATTTSIGIARVAKLPCFGPIKKRRRSREICPRISLSLSLSLSLPITLEQLDSTRFDSIKPPCFRAALTSEGVMLSQVLIT